ncbi:N,N-dimethylformamidase beta subunit family domain-containing protein [Pontibacter ramchanderi]|nr:N,N-dimethylformamidase beta subunit family domain-containing protein [Pontibacter ramchanderi]
MNYSHEQTVRASALHLIRPLLAFNILSRLKIFFYTCLYVQKKMMLMALFSCMYLPQVLAQNAIVIENAKTGNPASEWQISGAGDLSIQGFATDISYNKGETARFKIKTSARAYTIAIYRLGFYQGNGARLQGTGTVTATLPQSQPNCLTNSSTGLIDCGNWAVSATWAIPSTAVSGVYLAKLTRTDTGGSSHIVFIVRDDASTSDLFFQTSDATWQAYNIYGDNNNGKSLYTGSGGKAVKVSYNRPFLTRNGGGGGGPSEDWLFNAEYPMIRWIESNGYDVTYTTNVDSDRRGALIKNHKVFLSVGHDEYWSGAHRAHVTAARDAGTSLAFFSGNEVYWKTRWESSIDASGTPYRTLVCYKEGGAGENTCSGKCDPSPEWTGLWRSGCEYRTGDPLVDGCQPENALTGQISWEENTASLQVPGAYSRLRFWRNTSVASLSSGQTATFTFGTIGYEWNAELEAYRSHYPSGRIILSRTVINGKVHHLSLYKHTSGALVFGAGTVQYSWGLDSNHDRGNAAPSLAMQQATVNLFADMGAQPRSLRSNLIAATATTDTQAPVTTITSPSEGAYLPVGAAVTINGTASDANVIAGVEVSIDGGNTWRLANGTTSWTFSWTPTIQGAASIRARAFDDSGNMSVPVTVNVTVGGTATPVCPCTVFQPSATPLSNVKNDGQALQIGMKFRASSNGYVTGVRFYKHSGNTGTNTGQLYSSSGTLLASVVFSNETASGWQQALFSSPVAITAGTTYVISYHSSAGNYTSDYPYFNQAVVNGPLRALADGEDGPNGVYRYTASPAFPTSNYQASNYWVDVVFSPDNTPANQPPVVSITAPANNATFTAPASVNIAATASDTDGTVSKVEFFNGSTKLGEDLTSPYTFTWSNVAAGSYTLTARATDNAGAVTTSSAINITVNAPANQAPEVAITSPANGAAFISPASFTIQASASDADGTVTKVEFFQGTTKLGEDINGGDGWSFAWSNVSAGNYILTARATDDQGTTSTSTGAGITVNDPANNAPSVTIIDPANNSSFTAPATIILTADASDTDGTIAKVEFFSGGTKLGEDLTSPYSYTWGNVPAGSYVITARATDNAGAVTTSSTVSINVTAAAVPIITAFSPGSGPVGTIVTIAGSNLAGASRVAFGPSTAEIVTNTNTEIKAVVPSVNGKLPKSVNISVSTSGGSVTVKDKFTVTSGIAARTASTFLESESEENEHLIIHPNPFSDRTSVSFKIKTGGEFTLELYNYNGALITVLNKGNANPGIIYRTEINGKDFAKGWYIVKLKNKDSVHSTKLLHIK